MGDARTLRGAADALDKRLDPANFAYISDDTYSAEEVEAQTQVRRAAGAVACRAPAARRFPPLLPAAWRRLAWAVRPPVCMLQGLPLVLHAPRGHACRVMA